MKTSGNTILITGGATGIGFALASNFSNLGNEVIVCSRNEDNLKIAKEKLPEISTRRCDISKSEEVDSLFRWVTTSYPQINVLINNAGIQRQIELKKGIEALPRGGDDDEISINLRSQIYMSACFIPVFLGESAIVNVSSGLGFVPLARFPVYCATKAAIHSFTVSLRFQLKDSSIKVFEIIPPTVYDTNLKGKPLEKSDWAVSSKEVADAAVKGIENDQFEIPIGPTKNWLNASKSELDQAFINMNRW